VEILQQFSGACLCSGCNIVVHVGTAASNKVDMTAKEAMQDTCTTTLVLPFSFFGMKHHWVLIYEKM